MSVEHLHQLGEVGERPGQAVDLVDDDHVDPALLDVGEQLLHRRPFEGAAGVTAVVVTFSDQYPSLVGLAFHVGLGGFALGVERVELLLKARRRSTRGYRSRSAVCEQATIFMELPHPHLT